MPGPREDAGVAELPLQTAIGVGLAQCLAMIPGVSRSGATIMGALAMGVERKTAAEFCFFLAVPTMLGATTLELSTTAAATVAGGTAVGWGEIAIGFAVCVRGRAGRDPRLRRLRLAARLRPLRVVSHRGRRARRSSGWRCAERIRAPICRHSTGTKPASALDD